MATGILLKVKHLIWPFSSGNNSENSVQQRHYAGSSEPSTSSTQPSPAKKKAVTTDSELNTTTADVAKRNEVGTKLRQEFYQAVFLSDTIGTKKLSVPETLVLQVVEDNLKSPDYRIKAVPRLPSVVPQLLKSLRDPNSSANQYVDIIKQDPVIASTVLKMANSAYFNPSNQYIDSFQRAVVTLGIQGLRSLLSTAVMQPIIHCKSTYFMQFGKKLWNHSLCCAVACQILANQRGQDPFKAYLLGLSHDIGKITLFTQLVKQFKLNEEEKTPPVHAFIKLMDKIDLELSYCVAKDWGFPEDILKGMKDQIQNDRFDTMSSLGMTLYQANQACEAYLLNRAEKLSDQEAAQLLESLKLPADLYEQLDTLFIAAGH